MAAAAAAAAAADDDDDDDGTAWTERGIAVGTGIRRDGVRCHR